MKKSPETPQSTDLVWVDPPSGWQFGFPAIWDRVQCPYKEFLISKGYPEHMLELAYSYSRFWPVVEPPEEFLEKCLESFGITQGTHENTVP